MKPHIKTATTAGTAYGRKMTIRKKLAPWSRALSMASAASRARTSMIGTWIDEEHQHPQGAVPELVVGQDVGVVVQADEDVPPKNACSR